MDTAGQPNETRLLPRDVGAAVEATPIHLHKAWLIGAAVVALLFVLSWPVGLVVAIMWALLYIFLAATR